VRPNCSWWDEYKSLSPIGCFQWKLSHRPLPPIEPVAGPQPSSTSCKSFMCGALYEAHRGSDEFLDFEEMVALDEEARLRAEQGRCAWPGRLTRTSACWVDTSVGGNRELTGSVACRFLRCRAELGTPRAVCVSAVCVA
jgi:hypothetical protein